MDNNKFTKNDTILLNRMNVYRRRLLMFFIVALVHPTEGFIKGVFQKTDTVSIAVNITLCIILSVYIYYNKEKLNIKRINLFIFKTISLLLILILMKEIFIKFVQNNFGKDINALIEISGFVIVYFLAMKNYFEKKSKNEVE